MKTYHAVMGLLIVLSTLVCRTTSTAAEFRLIQKSELETGEVRLSSYRLPSGEQAVLFTRLLYNSASKVSGQLVYVDLENAQLERRRIWQRRFREFSRTPHSRIVSFVFGPGDSKERVSVAFSSNGFFIYVFLLDVTQSVPPKEHEQRSRKRSGKIERVLSSNSVPYRVALRSILPAEYDIDYASVEYPPMLKEIAYTQKDGWTLTFRIKDKLFTYMATLQAGVPSVWQEQRAWYHANIQKGDVLLDPVQWRLVNMRLLP